MCGLTGFWQASGHNEADMQMQVRRMTDAIEHRGPDDDGFYLETEVGFGLGFRRLAIVDLSPAGHQPMRSETGRYIIGFNGEVYNFGDLRQQLEALGHSFRGTSDTEVMLAAIEQWGLEDAVKRFVGMFAIALWDRAERTLSLVRDRLGIKPMYYGWMGQTFVYGSELKALRNHEAFKPEIDRGALTLFLRHGYIPAPYSIYQGVYKLPPGCILTLSSAHAARPSPVPYWSAKEVAERGHADLFQGGDQAAIERMDDLLREAVRIRMIADVPLGAFLSGGVDSSTVVALMQAQSARPVKTFSIGFNEAEYDEATHARLVAQHLGTEHTELYVSSEEAQAVIPTLPYMYDEPFADSSQIPTFLVSQLARKHVTVSLSGDGGDELFAGYNSYFSALSIWNKVGWVPGQLRPLLSNGIGAVRPHIYDRYLGWLAPYTRQFGGQGQVGDKLHKLAEVLEMRSPEDLYCRLGSHWATPTTLVVGGSEPATNRTVSGRWARLPEFAQRMMHMDMITYLPDDILTKVDRASMAVSLEARVPLLDHRVVEFAWRLPLSLKVRDGQRKWILRQVLYKYVPRQLLERPKMGFGVPIDMWLRGSLREWAENLLDERQMRDTGLLNPGPIRTKWAEHLSGERNWAYYLWDVLMFQAWHEYWSRDYAASAPAFSLQPDTM